MDQNKEIPFVPEQEPAKNKSSFMPIAVLLIALLAVGTVYFAMNYMDRSASDNMDNMESITDEELNSLELQSSSDEADLIEADLNATDIDSLDSDFSEDNLPSF